MFYPLIFHYINAKTENKMKILIMFLSGIAILTIGFYIFKNSKSLNAEPTSVTPTLSIVEPTNAVTVAITTNTPQAEENTIKAFFQKINDQKASEAVLMMTPDSVKDESTKQAWGVQFNSFKKVSILKIERSMPESWTTDTHSYKVTLDVEMKPEAASGPIPFYGYENGQNIRWIPLVKIGNSWKIQGLATGP